MALQLNLFCQGVNSLSIANIFMEPQNDLLKFVNMEWEGEIYGHVFENLLGSV